jgi:hypothetical protein
MKPLIILFLLLTCSTQKEIKSDFEGGKIDKIWKLKKLSKDSFQVQNRIVRSGKKAMKFSLLRGMKEGIGADGNITERVEIKERKRFHAKLGQDHLYQFSFYLPKDFPILKTRLVIGQWKQEGKNSPLVAQRFVGGRFFITISNPNGKKTILKLSESESRRLLGKWIDVEYLIRFAVDDGRVEVKFGTHKVSYQGKLAFPKDKNYIYFKFGLYRDQVSEPMHLYFDDYRHVAM